MPLQDERRARGPRGAARGSSANAPLDAVLIEEWALAYLGRYASSAENLRRVLRRRVLRRSRDDGESAAAARLLIDVLVARYRETGLLDDAAYAAARVRRGVKEGRSRRRIAAGLAAKGVDPAGAAAALAALRDGGTDPDLAAACAFARRRRFGPFRTGRNEEPQRELAAFARAGFDRRTAERVLACADEDAVAALLADPDD